MPGADKFEGSPPDIEPAGTRKEDEHLVLQQVPKEHRRWVRALLERLPCSDA